MLRSLIAALGVALLLSACADSSLTKSYVSVREVPKGITSASLSVAVVGSGPYGYLTPAEEASVVAMAKNVFTATAQKEGISLHSDGNQEAVEVHVKVRWVEKGFYAVFLARSHQFIVETTVTSHGTTQFFESQESGNQGCFKCGDLAGAAKKILEEQATKIMGRL